MGLTYTSVAFLNVLFGGIPKHLNNWIVEGNRKYLEFDPGSGRTLAVRLMHASRTRSLSSESTYLVADG